MAAELASYSVRAARADDRYVIKRMVRSARLNPFNLKWQRFVVAVDPHDRIIGCGQVRTHRGGSRELASVVVLPRWRGRGAASAIIKRLISIHDLPIWLTCASALVSFYERFGFRPVTFAAETPLYIRLIACLFNGLLRLVGRDANLALMLKEENV